MLSEKILVLEDDKVLRTLIVDTLLDEGYAVVDASCPEQAIALAEGGGFHLFITDVRMAGFTDGLGVLKILKSKHRGLRSLIITGYADLSSPALAMRLQADDYLFKGDQGFGMRQLLQVVRTVLDRRPPVHSLLGRFMAGSGSLLKLPMRALLAAQLPKIEAARERLFKVFYLGISSGHLSAEKGATFWQTLLALESHYLRRLELSSLPGLADGYANLSQTLIQPDTLESPALESLRAELGRDSIACKKPLPFRVIYQEIRNKRLSRQAFQTIPRLELEPASRDASAFNFTLYESLKRSAHGQPSQVDPARADTPEGMIGLHVGPFQVVKFLDAEPQGPPSPREGGGGGRGNEATASRWHFRAVRQSSGQARTLEVVPAERYGAEVLLRSMPAGSPLNDVEYAQAAIETDLPCGEENLRGRGFLVRPWPDGCPNFSLLFQAGGHDLGTSLAYIRPLWLAVEQAHRKGLVDGFLSAERIVLVNSTLKIRSFGATGHFHSFLHFGMNSEELGQLPFSPWHVDLANLCETGPRPCNDQFSLAILLCQLLSGETDPLPLVWSGYSEGGELQPGWLQDLVGNPEAEAVLHRMLSLNTARRYPDVRCGFEELCRIVESANLMMA